MQCARLLAILYFECLTGTTLKVGLFRSRSISYWARTHFANDNNIYCVLLMGKTSPLLMSLHRDDCFSIQNCNQLVYQEAWCLYAYNPFRKPSWLASTGIVLRSAYQRRYSDSGIAGCCLSPYGAFVQRPCRFVGENNNQGLPAHQPRWHRTRPTALVGRK